MQTERAVVIKGSFEIPVTALAPAFCITWSRGVAVLAIQEEILACSLVKSLPYRRVGGNGSGSLFVNVELAVVSTLDMPCKTLGDEVLLLCELEV